MNQNARWNIEIKKKSCHCYTARAAGSVVFCINQSANFVLFTPCIFLRLIRKKKNALNKIKFMTSFFVIKPNRYTNFTNIFFMKRHMFRTVRLPIIRNLFTVHSAMVYVIQVCRQLSSRTRMELQFHPAECTVNKFLMMDRRTVRNM
jgi:hypothetical protein